MVKGLMNVLNIPVGKSINNEFIDFLIVYLGSFSATEIM